MAALVKPWLMHLGEIDFMVRQATILASLRGGTGRPSFAEVHEVIGRYRRKDRYREQPRHMV